MDIKDPSDWGAVIGIVTVLLTVFSWLVRKWITDQIEKLVVPHLKNDETSVARYAHQARDAADNANEAAVAAKEAALASKTAAVDAKLAARETAIAVRELTQQMKDEGK
jgi:hypothetical protein